MKNILILQVAIVISFSTFAQSITHRGINGTQAKQQFGWSNGNLKNNHFHHLAERTTSTDTVSRCLAEVDYNHDGTFGYYVTDSIAYFYSGSEYVFPNYFTSYNYHFDNPNIQYNPIANALQNYWDSSYAFTYDTATHNYSLSSITIITKNISLFNIDFKTYDWNGGILHPSSQGNIVFDSYGNLTLVTQKVWSDYHNAWIFDLKDSTSCIPASNYINYEFMYNWDTVTSAWIPNLKTYYTYTTTNKWLQKIDYNWNALTLTWQKALTDSFTYDASNRVSINFIAQWNNLNNSWSSYLDKTQYTYNSSGNILEIKTVSDTSTYGMSPMHTWANAVWSEPNDKKSTFYDAGGNIVLLVDSTFDMLTGAFQYANIDSTFYNSHNMITDDYQIGGPAARYYYELLVINEVKNVLASAGDAQLYPVPTNYTLNVDISWENAQTSVLTIADITGKIVYDKSLAAAKENQVQIPVRSFGKGIYLLTITGEKGKIIKKFTIE